MVLFSDVIIIVQLSHKNILFRMSCTFSLLLNKLIVLEHTHTQCTTIMYFYLHIIIQRDAKKYLNPNIKVYLANKCFLMISSAAVWSHCRSTL